MSKPARIPVVGDWVRLNEWAEPPTWYPSRYYEVIFVAVNEARLQLRYYQNVDEILQDHPTGIAAYPLERAWQFKNSTFFLLPESNLEEIEKARQLIDSLTTG